MSQNNYTGFEIAVIGIAGRFPGASTIGEYWENIRAGKESLTFFTDKELIAMGVPQELYERSDYIRAGSFIKDKEFFDSGFFGYPAHEAAIMDPQIRIFHECVWEALEDSGNVNSIKNTPVALFAGATDNPYWRAYTLLQGAKYTVDSFSASQLSNPEFISTLIAYKLNLKGPAIYVNTACSTSLVAIHMACRSLLTGEAKMAIAGGVAFQSLKRAGYTYQEGAIFSADGHCRTFDANASGTIGGEGAGAVVLKKLQDALKDGDRIYAVVKGSAMNNDGSRKVGYTAPSADGQSECIRIAHKIARVEPKSIGYVEAHGTATKLGDPIEIQALKTAFGKEKIHCALGAVKANIGHLDAAAGVAGFIKTVLAITHRELPPSANFASPAEELRQENNGFYVNTKLKKWNNESGDPLRAGVSSFGIGGTNAHIVLEENKTEIISEKEKRPVPIIISAKTQSSLNNYILRLITYLEKNPTVAVGAVSDTLLFGRQEFGFRKGFVASSTENLLLQLKQSSEGPPAIAAMKQSPGLVFMFPGQGAQYAKMGAELYTHIPVFREHMNKGFELLKKLNSEDFHQIFFGNDSAKLNETKYTQPLVFLFQYALGKTLISYGIQPQLMIGHSLGEYALACISGVFSFEDGLSIVLKRAQLMTGIKGSMLSIALPLSHVNTYLQEGISVAAVNSPSSCVVSGDTTLIAQLEEKLKVENISCSGLKTSGAFHSSMLDEVLDEFRTAFNNISLHDPEIPFVSGLTGKQILAEEAKSPDYWLKHLRHTVLFSQGVLTLLQNKNCAFIEVGPGMVLSSLVQQHALQTKTQKCFNLIRHPQEEENDHSYFLKKIVQLWAFGVQIDWKLLAGTDKKEIISLPTYAFDKVKYKYIVEPSQLGFFQSEDVAEEPYELSENNTLSLNRDDKLLESDYMAPETAIEKVLADTWSRIFGIDKVGIHDDFFELGGNSLLAVRVISEIKKKINANVKAFHLFKGRTISGVGKLVSDLGTSGLLLELSPMEKDKANIFMVHAMNSGPEIYHSVAKKLSDSYNCYGIDNYNFSGNAFIESLPELATLYVKQLRQVQETGPYTILGYSLGGQIALEMAAVLEEQGEKEVKLFLMDALVPDEKIKDLLKKVDFKIIQQQLQRIKKMEGYDLNYIEMMYGAFPAEVKIYASGISRTLQSSNAILFKAGVLDSPELGNEENLNAIREHRITLKQNNVNSVCRNLTTIVLNCDHGAMFTQEDEVIKHILEAKAAQSQKTVLIN